MSFLPELPSGFGRDSAYPPMPSRGSPAHTPSHTPMHQPGPPGRPGEPGGGRESPARPVFMNPPEEDEDYVPAPHRSQNASPAPGMHRAPNYAGQGVSPRPDGLSAPAHSVAAMQRPQFARDSRATSASAGGRMPQTEAGAAAYAPPRPASPARAPEPEQQAYAAYPQAQQQEYAAAQQPAYQAAAQSGYPEHQPAYDQSAEQVEVYAYSTDTAAPAQQAPDSSAWAAEAPQQAAAPPQAPRSPPAALTASTSGMLPVVHMPLPDAKSLGEQRERAFAGAQDLEILRWATQVLKFVERTQQSTGSPPEDPTVSGWVDEAIIHIIQYASHPKPEAEALFARGELLASGAFPSYVAKDLRSAFSDFERSARMGWAPSWFRIGRDYETLGDIPRARSAFERGAQLRDVSSTYRLAMACLLGQLQLEVDKKRGVQLLQVAAQQATLDTPHPAYIYGLLLAGELDHVDLTPPGLAAMIDEPQANRATWDTLAPLARGFLERAAYLNLAPAQYKCGWCYEHAKISFPFDPLLSVQYYSAASQGGEVGADMALSKWFLCGAEHCFEKNEALAWTFADRAARHGLPTAQFALGYYAEVGIGTQVDLAAAKDWYAKAAAQGNTDASERLAALERSQAETLSRAQHQHHLDTRLYAEHTNAMQQPASRAREDDHGAVSYGYPNAASGTAPAEQSSELVRSRTMRMAEASAHRAPRRPPAAQPPQPPPPAPRPGGAAARGRSPTGRPATSDRKGFSTFSEMGIPPKQDKECVIC